MLYCCGHGISSFPCISILAFVPSFSSSSKNDIIKTDLLTEKGVYPYDYMNTFDKFNDEQLPSKEQFYSRLSEEDIANDDCNRAKQIRRHFNIKNMGVYRDLYLQTDALLLTYVLEQKLGTRVPSLLVLK